VGGPRQTIAYQRQFWRSSVGVAITIADCQKLWRVLGNVPLPSTRATAEVFPALAAAITRLMTEPGVRRCVVEHGLARVARDYTANTARSQHLSLDRELISKHRRPR
jgi:hypothetical protein